MQHSITLINENRVLQAQHGEKLLKVLSSAGVAVDAPCGGHGTCGKCLVEIQDDGGIWRRVKACMVSVERDCSVRTLKQSGLSNVLVNGGSKDAQLWNPVAQAVRLQVEKCRKHESTSDWFRLQQALDKAVGSQPWRIVIPLASKLGALMRETDGALWAVISGDHILDLCAAEPELYLAAVDVGTTSLAGYLIDVRRQKIAAQTGMLNPQTSFGADVISRAEYVLEHGGEALSSCIRTVINDLIAQLCDIAGCAKEQIYAVNLVGNTCMHHLLLGVSPASLVSAPYNPALNESLDLKAEEFGISLHPNARMLLPPVIAGFVGADTVGCLVAGDWERREELSLMIDIGTNGELVLGNHERMIACSTAAGPAFEGAKILCGMRGTNGAIDHVWVENGTLRYHVIGDCEAVGVCGSGLMDLAAALLKLGEIDESGRMENGKEYRIGDTNVVLTQKDVREIQLAKAAIATGIYLMAEHIGVTLEDIKSVEIAGAFGNFMNPDSACAIGLIPMELREKIRMTGNAAGEGAKRMLTNAEDMESAKRLVKRIEFLELASSPDFQDRFVDELEFPGV